MSGQSNPAMERSFEHLAQSKRSYTLAEHPLSNSGDAKYEPLTVRLCNNIVDNGHHHTVRLR